MAQTPCDKSGLCPAAAGTSVTVNLGGNAVDTAHPDSGNAAFVFAIPFTTPASMTSPSFGNCHVYFASPDSGTPDWGCALYANSHTTYTINTSGTAVTATAGSFNTAWGHGYLTINGIPYTVSSWGSSTTATLTSSAGTQTGVAGSFDAPGALIASAFSSTVATAGWNSIAISGIGTPTPNTIYWLASVTASNTQTAGRVENSNCGNPYQATFGNQLSSFTSNGSWPTPNFNSSGSIATANDGCIASYIPVSYTTTAPYTIISYIPGTCDAAGTTCQILIPPTGSGHGFLIISSTSSAGAPVTTPTDSASDTFTVVGSGPVTVTGASVNYSQAMYWTDRVSSGVTSITCNYTALNKDTCYGLEILGTISSGSVDKSCYQTATSSSTPFSGCTTGSTANAVELWLGVPWNLQLGSVGLLAAGLVPTGSWSLLGNGAATGGNSPVAIAVYTQTTASTGTCTPTGVTISSGSNSLVAHCVTLK